MRWRVRWEIDIEAETPLEAAREAFYYMQKPDSGDEAYRISANLYDTSGQMEDPNYNQILVRVIKDDGTYITDKLYKENALTNP